MAIVTITIEAVAAVRLDAAAGGYMAGATPQ